MGGILAHDTGLGKTRTALDTARAAEAERILVVAPTSVCRHWETQRLLWWPGGPPLTVTTPAKAASLPAPTSGAPWDLVILDEVDLFKNRGARRSAAVAAQVAGAKMVIGASATVMSREVDDLHHPLDLVWPRRFGSLWSFENRYLQVGKNSAGFRAVGGAREDTAGELASRLAAGLVHVARNSDPEVQAAMPKLAIEAIWVKRDRRRRATGPDGEARVESFQAISLANKIKALLDALPPQPTLIFAHRRASVETIAAALANAGRHVVWTHGGEEATDRLETAEAAVAAGADLVCTMHSLGVGVDALASYRHCFLAELYWVPRIVVQAIGRVHRLSSDRSVPTSVRLLLAEHSPDEAMAMAVQRRLEEQGYVLRAGGSDAALSAALSRAESLAELIAAARDVTEDPYLADAWRWLEVDE